MLMKVLSAVSILAVLILFIKLLNFGVFPDSLKIYIEFEKNAGITRLLKACSLAPIFNLILNELIETKSRI